jgi:MoxR-like ATPase
MSSKKSPSLYQRIDSIIQHLLSGLFERDRALRLSLLAALSGQSVFFLGPPGVAKSMVARRLAAAFKEARFFEYLMGRFSTPDELFGPVSIARLKHEDRYTRNTEGFLPDADIVFLDEIWKASPPIQNTLLGALNERIFRNGDEVMVLPLKCFIAASNEIQQSDETRAFWDRFLIRLTIEPIESDRAFFAMISESGEQELPDLEQAIRSDEWEDWTGAYTKLELGEEVLAVLGDLRSALARRAEEDPEYYVSDRRWKMISLLLRASAFYHGRESVSLIDSFLVPHCIWNRRDHAAESSSLFIQAVESRAFSETAAVETMQSAKDSLVREIERSATEEIQVEVLEPVRYDGEYLLFVPEQDAGDTSYRIWYDDLEDLDERGELELFIHEGGAFRRTELHRMSWVQRSAWTLDGDIGAGRIDCQARMETRLEPRPLTGEQNREFSRRCSEICRQIEERINRIEGGKSQLAEDAAAHLFIPGEDIEPARHAADNRRGELEQILAGLMELGSSRGLELE